jgi:hypothetical protein
MRLFVNVVVASTLLTGLLTTGSMTHAAGMQPIVFDKNKVSKLIAAGVTRGEYAHHTFHAQPSQKATIAITAY